MSAAPDEMMRRHTMIGSAYPETKTRADLETFSLAPRQVEFYRDNGYLCPVRIFELDEVESIRQRLEAIIDDDFPHRDRLIGINVEKGVTKDEQMIYFQNAWMVDEVMHDTLFNTRMTVPLHQLLGVEKVRFFHDQVFYKPARHGGVVAWHQDYSYWTRTVPQGHVTCFVALDDSNLENGCMQVVPGSQKWDILPRVPLTGGIEDMKAIKEVMSPEQLAAFKPVPLILKAGEASFHHPVILHGSYPNKSDRKRRGLVLNFMKADTRSDSNDPIMPGTPVIPKGEIIQGDAFPIVFDLVRLNLELRKE